MNEDITDPELTGDEEALLRDLPADDDPGLPGFGAGRRHFIKQVLAGSGGVLALELIDQSLIAGAPAGINGELLPPVLENMVQVSFKVNGISRSLQVDSRTTLLDALRDRLELTGSKKGCDHGQCGACTVLQDGHRVISCLTLAASSEGKSYTTVEGLAKNNTLHPMQAAFLRNDGFQCGYCTPGQICSAIGMLKEAKNGDASYVTSDISAIDGNIHLSPDEIRERMSGNICRCGAYPNIIAAIEEVHTGKDSAEAWTFVEQDNLPV